MSEHPRSPGEEEVGTDPGLRPTDDRLIDADVEGLVGEGEDLVPDDDRVVPEDFNEFVPDDDESEA